MRAARLLPSLFILAVIAPSCTFERYSAKATERVTVPYIPATPIEVTSRNGGIEIKGGAQRQDIIVHASITAGGRSQDEADERLDQVKVRCRRDGDDRLVVAAEFPGEHRNRDSVSYVIELPDADGAKLSTSNGTITVRAITGRLDVRTSNGRIDIEDHSGPVDAHTSNGPVKLADVLGPVAIRTSNGSVRVDMRPESEGPVNIRTSNGKIQLGVGTGFTGAMTLNTSNGRVRFKNNSDLDIRTKLKKRSGQLVFSRSGGDSKVRSSNGGITVTLGN